MTFDRRSALGALIFLGAVVTGSCSSTGSDATMPGADGPVVRGISYIGISVSDIDRTAAYFTGAGGLVEVDGGDLRGAALDRIGGKTIRAKTRTLRSSSGQIRLMQFDRPSAAARAAKIVPVQGPGITHVCFQSPDNRPIFPKFVAAGAKPLSRTGDLVQLRPDVPVKYAYLRDADGTMIEIEQLLLDNLSFDHRMRHVAIASMDIDRTVAFYTAVLGKAPRERRSNLVNKTLDVTANLDDMKLDVAWFQVGNLELEIWEYLNPVPTPATEARPLEALGHNMIVFDVSDPAVALQRLQEAGGLRVASPSPMDGGQIAFGRDPDGNLIGLFRPGSASSPFSTLGLTY
jgi:catechol 2,3-dioxygenase-like lactoylglutathione lyase family enzyme